MKLSAKQQRVLDQIRWTIEHGYEPYLECGKYKPFHVSTLRSLENKSLIKLTPIFHNHYGTACIFTAELTGE